MHRITICRNVFVSINTSRHFTQLSSIKPHLQEMTNKESWLKHTWWDVQHYKSKPRVELAAQKGSLYLITPSFPFISKMSKGMWIKTKNMHNLKKRIKIWRTMLRITLLMHPHTDNIQQTSCIRVAESKVSASAVKWRGATLTCPAEEQKYFQFRGIPNVGWPQKPLNTTCLWDNIPAIARPHWSRSHATAQASVFPVVGLVVTKRTKSASETPSGEVEQKGNILNSEVQIWHLIFTRNAII